MELTQTTSTKSTTACDNTRIVHLSNPILQTNGLSIGYERWTISTGLDLTIRNGEMVCLLGQNGCGKSTLMRSIAGLQAPLAGTVLIKNKDIRQLKIADRALLLSLVLTDRIEAGNLTVADIVAIGRHPHTNGFGTLTDADRAVINKSLSQCGLTGFSQRLFVQLSDGEKQRVMIARALAQDTPLIMLDEPTAHLDLPNRIEMMRNLRQLAKETNKAILLSTHELDLALQWADTLWLMDNNGTIHSGCPEDLILNGSFTRVFGNESFFFDMVAGSFKMKRPFVGTVNLYGNGIVFEWTRRALDREGYGVDVQFNYEISVEILGNGKWLYSRRGNHRSLNTIGELLAHMRHEKVKL